jgi:hypothetical protein
VAKEPLAEEAVFTLVLKFKGPMCPITHMEANNTEIRTSNREWLTLIGESIGTLYFWDRRSADFVRVEVTAHVDPFLPASSADAPPAAAVEGTLWEPWKEGVPDELQDA